LKISKEDSHRIVESPPVMLTTKEFEADSQTTCEVESRTCKTLLLVRVLCKKNNKPTATVGTKPSIATDDCIQSHGEIPDKSFLQ
jgi:hypothetical protein